MLDTATLADREEALDRWLAPFLERFQRAEHRHWAPLSLPKAWTDAPARHRKAGVPEDVRFRTKGEIALDEHAFRPAPPPTPSPPAVRRRLARALSATFHARCPYCHAYSQAHRREWTWQRSAVHATTRVSTFAPTLRSHASPRIRKCLTRSSKRGRSSRAGSGTYAASRASPANTRTASRDRNDMTAGTSTSSPASRRSTARPTSGGADGFRTRAAILRLQGGALFHR